MPVRLARLASIVLCFACVASCGPSTRPATIRVLAASSLTDALGEIGAAFEHAEPGTRVEFSFAASNQLRLQLEQGSPGDVFISADRTQMEAATVSSAVRAESTIVFTSNELAILVPAGNPAKITSLADLATGSIRLIIADSAVPAGRLTSRLLEAAKHDPALGEAFAEGVAKNIVSREQSASALGAKVALGEADAAIAYASEAFGSRRSQVKAIPLPASLREHTEYLAAVTSHAAAPAQAERFVAFLRTTTAQAMLASRGFVPAETSRP